MIDNKRHRVTGLLELSESGMGWTYLMVAVVMAVSIVLHAFDITPAPLWRRILELWAYSWCLYGAYRSYVNVQAEQEVRKIRAVFAAMRAEQDAALEAIVFDAMDKAVFGPDGDVTLGGVFTRIDKPRGGK